MQLIKQISTETPLGAIIAESEAEPARIIEGFLMMTGSSFTRLSAQLDLSQITLSRIVNAQFKNRELLGKYRRQVAAALGWPLELLWPEEAEAAEGATA